MDNPHYLKFSYHNDKMYDLFIYCVRGASHAHWQSKSLRGPIWTLNEHENLHFDNGLDNHVSYKKLVVQMLQMQFGIANQVVLVVCFISYKKWVQIEQCSNNTRLQCKCMHKWRRKDEPDFTIYIYDKQNPTYYKVGNRFELA